MSGRAQPRVVVASKRRRAIAPAPTLPERVEPVAAIRIDAEWVALHDDELLQLRVCDLDLRLDRSELRFRVEQLYSELAAAGLALQPSCYLGDEWFTPAGSTLIALPFYLAHPRLRGLERRQMREVEGGSDEECMMLLRHECGHAFDHAFRFSRRPRWKALFGESDSEQTPDAYRPRPYSKAYVRHIKNHYAQAHPDEDFAETFAVILGSRPSDWRRRYRGWKALEKLEYVYGLVQEAKGKRPRLRDDSRISDARRMTRTLARYYADRRRDYAEDFPDFLDPDLFRLFGRREQDHHEAAARFLRRRRDPIVNAVVAASGAHKYTVDDLLRRLITRCEELELVVRHVEARTLLDLGAYLAALVTTHLHTGRYKRTV